MARIVECKLNERQQRAPRARVLGAMRAEDVLNHAIDPLSLAIRLWVIRGGHRQTGAQKAEQFTPEGTGEPRISIAYDRGWHSVQTEYMLNEQCRALSTRH
jgi:hypothetical protein